MRFCLVGKEELLEWKCDVDELMLIVGVAMEWAGGGEWARGFLYHKPEHI